MLREHFILKLKTLFVLIIILLTACSTAKYHNEWVQQGDKYYYYDNNGNKVKNQWQKYDNDWHYLDSTGAMERSQWIGEYYVDEDGKMLKNTFHDIGNDTYEFDNDGKSKKISEIILVSSNRGNLGAMNILLSTFTSNSLDDYMIKIVTFNPPTNGTTFINCMVVSNLDSHVVRNQVYPIKFILKNDKTYIINSLEDTSAVNVVQELLNNNIKYITIDNKHTFKLYLDKKEAFQHRE